MVCDTEGKTRSAGIEVNVGNDSIFLKRSNASVGARPPRLVSGVLSPHLRQLLEHLWQNMHGKMRRCLTPESECLFLKGKWATGFKSWRNLGYVMFIAGQLDNLLLSWLFCISFFFLIRISGLIHFEVFSNSRFSQHNQYHIFFEALKKIICFHVQNFDHLHLPSNSSFVKT